MLRYELFQAKWNVDKLFHEVADEGGSLIVIFKLRFIVILLESLLDYFESED